VRFLTKTHQLLTEADTFIIIQRGAFFMDKVMIDLFSGLGGASEAFLRDGWHVIRYDNNRAFCRLGSNMVPNTAYCDMMNWKEYLEGNDLPDNIEFVWASPPCYEFSNAANAPRAKAAHEGRLDEYNPDMTLLENTINAIEWLQPKYWCIENVIGSTRYFEHYLGKPNMIMGPYVLWGNFPPGVFKLEVSNEKKLAGDKYRHSPLRSNYRAKIPLWLSEQMLDTLKHQTTFERWA